METAIYGHVVADGKIIKSNDGTLRTDSYVEYNVVLDNNNDGFGEVYTVFAKKVTYDGQDPDVYKRIAVKGVFVYIEGELTNNCVINSNIQISLPPDMGDRFKQGDRVIEKIMYDDNLYKYELLDDIIQGAYKHGN